MPVTTYAIGDIHGRRDLLDQLLAMVEADAAERGTAAKIVFTGDYVDRGVDSRGVLDRLMAGPKRHGDTFVCLRGNHDALFCQAVAMEDGLPDWLWNLFWHTIGSFEFSRDTFMRNHKSFRRYLEFIRSLSLTHDDGTHLFVHAGIRPGVAIADQDEQDLIWIREEFLDHPHPLPRRVVHGHTIMGDRPVVKHNRISIDTGAFKSGILTAAVLDGSSEVTFLQAVGEPDRGAIVREAIIVAGLQGREVTPRMHAAFEAYRSGAIDLVEMESRLRLNAA